MSYRVRRVRFPRLRWALLCRLLGHVEHPGWEEYDSRTGKEMVAEGWLCLRCNRWLRDLYRLSRTQFTKRWRAGTLPRFPDSLP